MNLLQLLLLPQRSRSLKPLTNVQESGSFAPRFDQLLDLFKKQQDAPFSKDASDLLPKPFYENRFAFVKYSKSKITNRFYANGSTPFEPTLSKPISFAQNPRAELTKIESKHPPSPEPSSHRNASDRPKQQPYIERVSNTTIESTPSIWNQTPRAPLSEPIKINPRISIPQRREYRDILAPYHEKGMVPNEQNYEENGKEPLIKSLDRSSIVHPVSVRPRTKLHSPYLEGSSFKMEETKKPPERGATELKMEPSGSKRSRQDFVSSTSKETLPSSIPKNRVANIKSSIASKGRKHHSTKIQTDHTQSLSKRVEYDLDDKPVVTPKKLSSKEKIEPKKSEPLNPKISDLDVPIPPQFLQGVSNHKKIEVEQERMVAPTVRSQQKDRDIDDGLVRKSVDDKPVHNNGFDRRAIDIEKPRSHHQPNKSQPILEFRIDGNLMKNRESRVENEATITTLVHEPKRNLLGTFVKGEKRVSGQIDLRRLDRMRSSSDDRPIQTQDEIVLHDFQHSKESIFPPKVRNDETLDPRGSLEEGSGASQNDESTMQETESVLYPSNFDRFDERVAKQIRRFFVHLDQVKVHVQLNSQKVQLHFVSHQLMVGDQAGRVVEEVMQEYGFKEYEVRLQDRKRTHYIASSKLDRSAAVKSVIDVKV